MSNNHRSCPSHCCILHGCKYGYDDCPVENMSVVQEYVCEQCGMEGINSLEDLKFKQEATGLEIRTTDKKLMLALIDFLNEYPVDSESTTVLRCL